MLIQATYMSCNVPLSLSRVLLALPSGTYLRIHSPTPLPLATTCAGVSSCAMRALDMVLCSSLNMSFGTRCLSLTSLTSVCTSRRASPQPHPLGPIPALALELVATRTLRSWPHASISLSRGRFELVATHTQLVVATPIRFFHVDVATQSRTLNVWSYAPILPLSCRRGHM